MAKLYFRHGAMNSSKSMNLLAIAHNYEEFKKKNVKVIGISKDSVKSHMNFQNDYELPFTLLADPDMVAVNGFGVAKANNGVNRSTFIIDENGIIEKVFAQADPDNNAAEILEYLN